MPIATPQVYLALIKIPFVIVNTLSIRRSVRSPNPAPQKDDQAKYRDRKETGDLLSRLVWMMIPLAILTAHLFDLSEIYIILSTAYPSLRILFLHRILLPAPAKLPTLANLHLSTTFLIGSFILYAGTYLRIICYRHLGRHFTLELSIQKEHKLVTDGPYSVVRHPSYLGMFMTSIGIITIQFMSPGSWWKECGMWGTWQGRTFAAYWTLMPVYTCSELILRVRKEDTMLKMTFGEQWVHWSRKTPYAMIPYVY